MDPQDIVIAPLATEKVFTLMEEQNTLVFIVDVKATKPQIKWAIEKLYEIRVAKVRTLISIKNEKRAYVRLTEDYNAADLATNLGLF